MELLATLQADAASFGGHPLLVLPDDDIIDLENGYIPLLTDFSFEDKAAKGLRKRKAGDKPEPPVYFSALEVVRDNAILFLSGESGSGKTTFAKYLCFHLATTGSKDGRDVIRNDSGIVYEESWYDPNIIPCYFGVESLQTLLTLVNVTMPNLLQYLETINGGESKTVSKLFIVLDAVENAGDEASSLLARLITLVHGLDHVRLLILGDTDISKRWTLPSVVVRHSLLPLLEAQRNEALSRLVGPERSFGTGIAAANATIFALALQAKHPGEKAHEVIDSWLSIVLHNQESAERLAREAFESIASKDTPHVPENTYSRPLLLSSLHAVQQLLAARHLATLPSEAAISLFHREPLTTQTVMRSLLSRLSSSDNAQTLSERLIGLSPRGALLVSAASTTTLDTKYESLLRQQMISIISEDTLSASERSEAGRVLARLGDPRDLTELANVPAGTFVFGSNSHPNSRPQATMALGQFRIGVYPVVNRDYSLFVQDTGRQWLSLDGHDASRSNAPATDLTWHDARAYCKWVTDRWRAIKKISLDEEVRLPTEPEWERAATADFNQISNDDNDDHIYPWGREWLDDACNSEETGFNGTCAVGLFPRGRSPYGCYDMAGQVWEWCTTAWGQDMSRPSFAYPWREADGREDVDDAPDAVRRVLRGGCFSSGRLKACGTYRGSLEPVGFWRGNGFRVVVAK